MNQRIGRYDTIVVSSMVNIADCTIFIYRGKQSSRQDPDPYPPGLP